MVLKMKAIALAIVFVGLTLIPSVEMKNSPSFFKAILAIMWVWSFLGFIVCIIFEGK
jgi:hypothetical protein